MASHFSILPSEIMQYLSLSQDQQNKTPLRLLRLPHPRTGLPSLFLPTEGLPSTSKTLPSVLEIQSVSPVDQRSWIMGEDIIADGRMLVMTPIDPSFLLLPIMQATQAAKGTTSQFRTSDDLFDEAAGRLTATDETEKVSALKTKDILDFCSLSCISKSLKNICEVKEISDEIVVYRYSPAKVNEYMRKKVAHLSGSKALEESRTTTRNLAKEGLMEDGQEELLTLGKTRACCDLVSQYLPPDLREALINSYDFKRLNKLVDANKEEAVAKAAAAAPTKGQPKVAADKKRKSAKPSVGVEKLKKANTTGMAKLSSFFGKAN
ncbi:hypothetical protein D9619_002013 [Psilocybe cf. subviscida]|uniref:Ribonuclease H2 subunit B n=1 Tax=Psilocybe cf. subviscida TaxID=2480587 RepID=A0A8H5BGB0_9AGAR|nr:hypothetical protein D9619_002013 [Psilocybe cf. subviscida]